jgi:D-alanyl-D-alanine carboxypeptidase
MTFAPKAQTAAVHDKRHDAHVVVRRAPLLRTLALAATLAASLSACGGDAKEPTAPAPIAAVTVTAAATSLSPGESTQLVASASTAAGHTVSGAQFTWLSETPAVAAVDAAGRVTAVSAGSAVIAATAGTVRGTVTITVAQSLSSIVDSIRLAFNMPAMGAAIVTLENGLTAIAVAGTRRATGGAAVSTNDLWHLGSNIKAMTSLLAAVAVSQNRIGWTTTVGEAFPELTNIRAEHRDVTLRELLSHQSGFARDVNQAALGTGTTPAQRASLVAWAVEQPRAVARGTYLYSNLAFVVAGVMLERAFGIPFEAAIAAHLYTPLGVTDAGWGPQAAAGSTTQPVAHTWQPNGTWLAREGFDSPPAVAPAGAAHMSLTSWARLVREVLRVEAGTSTVAPAVIARQTTSAAVAVNATTSYGLGWYITTTSWSNGKVLWHDGINTANHSLAVIAPVRNVALLATTNGFDPGGRSWNALNALISRLETFHTTGR